MSALEPFEVGGQTYRAGKINAMTQLHVVRRLAPLIGSVQAMQADPDGAGDGDLLGRLAGPLATALAAMSDADTEYVVGACLSVCQRQAAGGLGWTPVWSVQAKQPMFDDVDLLAMLQIAAKVLMANVASFTSALPQSMRDKVVA